MSDNLPALVSNGVVGMRVPAALQGGWCTVNGYIGRADPRQPQHWARAPYPLGLDVKVRSQRWSLAPQSVATSEQRYDFATGELRTQVGLRLEYADLRLDVLTFVSRTSPHVVCQRTVLTGHRAIAVTLLTRIETAVSGTLECCGDGTFHGTLIADVVARFASPGGLSRLGIAAVSRLDGTSGSCDGTETAFAVAAGDATCVLEQFAALVPECAHSEPELQASRLVHDAHWRGFDALQAANRAAWSDLWRSRVVIDGPADAQRLADAAFFHLHANTHPSMPGTVGLCGLGLWPTYHMFHGHAFWDAETFCVPALSHTAPDTARRMLEWRFEGLDAAHRTARMNGYRGAMFPWEASLRGEDVTPIGWPKVFLEHHITLDVGNACLRHASVSGDGEFVRRVVWPIVHDVAEWCVSRVARTARGVELLRVTGIDEELAGVDNNAWTNLSAMMLLRGAVALARSLAYDTPAAWSTVIEALRVPCRNGVLLKEELHPAGESGLCPEPAMALFPLGWSADEATETATLREFVRRRGGVIGLPMVSPFYVVWAARLGDRALAARLFEEGCAAFRFGSFDMIDEFATPFTEGIKPRVGPYLAHCGGILQSLLLGLPGIEPDAATPPSAWLSRSVVLPEGWRAIYCESFHVRGKTLQLVAKQGARAQLIG